MTVFFLSAAAGVAHWGMTYVPYAVPVGAVLVWIGVWAMVRGLRS